MCVRSLLLGLVPALAAMAPRQKRSVFQPKLSPVVAVPLLHPDPGDGAMEPVVAVRQVFTSLTQVVHVDTTTRRETRAVYGLGETSVSSALQAQVFLMASMVATTATDSALRQDMEDYALELFAG